MRLVWVMRCPFTSCVLLSCISWETIEHCYWWETWQPASVSETHTHTHCSSDICWDPSGSFDYGIGTLTRTKDTTALMTCPHWQAQAEKQEVETRLGCQRGQPSWEKDLNTVEKSHRQREVEHHPKANGKSEQESFVHRFQRHLFVWI